MDFFTVAQEHDGRIYGATTYGPDVLVRRAGTNDVGARDRLETLNIQLTDDRGRRVTAATQFAVK